MIIEVSGMNFKLEDGYEKLNPMPDDPAGSVVYMRNGKAGSLVVAYPILTEYTMPMDDTKFVEDDIKANIGTNQEIIEVKNGKTKEGQRYIYSVVKTFFVEQNAVQYFIYLEVEYPENSLRIEASFQQNEDADAPYEEAKAFIKGIVA